MSERTSPTIDAFEFARSQAHLEAEVPVAQLARLAESLFSTDGVLRYRIDGLIDDAGRPGAEMRLQANLSLVCQRCNEPLPFDLDRTTHFRFVRSEEELNALPVEDDEIDAVVGSRAMDVIAWIEDEAILSLPLVPRHLSCSMPSELGGAEDPVQRANPFAELVALKHRNGEPN